MPTNKREHAVTAGELIARLDADPAYMAHRRAREKEIQDRVDRETAASRPLLDDLARAGHPIESLSQLTAPNPAALHVLAAHLRRDEYPDPIRDQIARALNAPAADFAWKDLVDLFRDVDQQTFRQFHMGLGVALSELASRPRLPEVRTLLRDGSLGAHRVFFLGTLMRLRAPDRWERVEWACGDDDLQLEAEHLLHQRSLREQRSADPLRVDVGPPPTLAPCDSSCTAPGPSAG